MLNWSHPNANPIQDLLNAKQKMTESFNKTYIIAIACTEAMSFAIEQENNAADFLKLWGNGHFATIKKHYPDFDLTTEAQQFLISQSGGEV